LGGNTIIGHDCVIGSSVWLTRSVEPFATVTIEKPSLRIRGKAAEEIEPEASLAMNWSI
jgi:serine O-acetyltransferase